MTVLPPARGRADRFRSAVADVSRASLGFLPVVLMVRAYERASAGAGRTLPPGTAGTWMRTALSDVAFTLCVAVLLALPVLALAQAAPRAARVGHRLLLVGLALVGVALAQYFATTLVPLGADLYGYRLADIRETVGASHGITPGTLIPFVLIGAAAWMFPALIQRLRWPHWASVALAVLSAVALGVPSLLVPPREAFASDGAYFLSVNKTGWLARRSIEHAVSRVRLAREAAALAGYPLMHRVAYEDVLGPQLTLGRQPPNIVVVIVEGLGRDFTGPGAEYGGFTPFLDSLADRSLSWDNFLSTSGRTFGILPSLLGSLPFGETGFMELGARMPAHASLVTLLRQHGYVTSYFTGTNGQFDRIDAFMERQGVDRFVDESGFGPGYARQPAGQGGVTWGFPDGALFRRSLELIGDGAGAPRLDVYLTITTHEPFVPPDSASWAARFAQRLAALPVSEAKRAAYRENAGVFSTLLYTDDALRAFFAAYAARGDYARTLFIVTGDHRLIPVPPSSRIARYHVPFIVASPMLRTPHHIGAVSSHLDVVPSVLALLQHGYGLAPPDSAPWLGTGLDTTTRFRHVQALALMRTKNELDEYLEGTRFLSGGQFYRLDSAFTLTAESDGSARSTAIAQLDRFRAVNMYVTTRDRLVPASGLGVTRAEDPVIVAREDSVYRGLGLERATPERAFAAARELAAQRKYETARLVARRLLREAPSYHDARALLGRTYGWERRFDEARTILEDLARRAPAYADGQAALVELDVWQEHGDAALDRAVRALARFPGSLDLLYGKARALELLGRRREALVALDERRRRAPDDPEATALRRRLGRP